MRSILLLIYKIIWIISFVTKQKICSFLFKIMLLANNVDCGHNIRTTGAIPQLRINRKKKNVKFGNNITFNNYNDVAWHSKCAIWVKKGASLIVGNDSGFNGALIYASDSIVIGNNVKVGGETKIFDTDFHPLNYMIRRFSNEETMSAPIVIEDDVFIGTSCLILKGVHIGARSVVAAGSVVTKSIPADEIWGGNPARFIRKLV